MQTTIMNYGWWRTADVGKVSGGGGRRRGAGAEWDVCAVSLMQRKRDADRNIFLNVLKHLFNTKLI